MKTILGLDLGTNSIGWAVVRKEDNENKAPEVLLGSRIIPMDEGEMSDFGKGLTNSAAKERRGKRMMRRILARRLLRRERLLRVLHVLGWLPKHFDQAHKWDKSKGGGYAKQDAESEVRLPWVKDEAGQMSFLFSDSFAQMLSDFAATCSNGSAEYKVPADWTLYYLRTKALHAPITREELAWVLLSFNQKRGYQLARGEFEKDGITPKKDREGGNKYSIRAPKEDDWALRKKRTEHQISESGLTVGAFIYKHLREQPSEKIRGEYVHTIDRILYKEELRAILAEQSKYHPELNDKMVFEACANELYPRNDNHRAHLLTKDLSHLIIEDILFYQRPLKSKKSLIDDCPFEKRSYVDKDTGEIKTKALKCVPKSNPLYQEFRLWQWISNLRIYDRETDREVTEQYLAREEDRVRLYDWLSVRKAVKQEDLMKDFLGIKKPKDKGAPYPLRWNYVEDKPEGYPAGETRAALLTALQKAGIDHSLILDPSIEYRLWHLLYSVTDRSELESALKKWSLGEAFVEHFLRIKPFESSYGAYSEKAIKKLLSVMRSGKYWSAEAVCPYVGKRLANIATGREEQALVERMSKSAPLPQDINACHGLSLWQASYLVYGRHSEASEQERWTTPAQMQAHIRSIRHNSLRNPVVEKVVLETLRVVHDIWQQVGSIDEIHVEMGRDMKATADERRRIQERQLQNEATNIRLRSLLVELEANNDGRLKCQEVRSYSPIHQDLLRIYEEGALATLSEKDKDYDDIIKISRQAQPSSSDLQRYRLWLEQRYRSPYTGRFISLTQLFTRAYEVEHVIPKSLYFDDSLNNKVICETEINKAKGNSLGHPFITEHGGEIFQTEAHGPVAVLKPEEYEQLVNTTFAGDKFKRKRANLLSDDLPEAFAQSQLNNTRYITRVITSALAPIVREENEKEALPKHLIVCSGKITDQLKRDWGLQDVWNALVFPRFDRLNKLTDSDAFGHWEIKEGKRVFQTQMPIDLQKGFQKKRIDHRHHAMDALVVACTTRTMIQYLNNEAAGNSELRYQLRAKLKVEKYRLGKPWSTFTQDAKRALQQVVVSFKQNHRIITRTSNRYTHYDGQGKKQLVQQVSGGDRWAIRKSLHEDTVYGRVNLHRQISVPLNKGLELAFKQPDCVVDQDLRQYILGLIRRGAGLTQLKAHFKKLDKKWNGQDLSTITVWQWSDDNEPLVATRKSLSPDIKIKDITDTAIQKILTNYLNAKGGKAEIAFSPEGVAELNANIALYNDGHAHQPIRKVRIYEPLGARYQVGEKGNRKKKWVKTAKGTNLFFAIYADAKGKRSFCTPTLREVIERKKQGLPPVSLINEKGENLLFTLSPHDLVYVPTDEQKEQPVEIHELLPERIFVMRKCTGTRCYFLPQTIAKTLYDKHEFTSINIVENFVLIAPTIPNNATIKANAGTENAEQQPSIKQVCWKLEVDRLGRITRIIR